MTRLDDEYQRLYLPRSTDPQDHRRAAVLALAAPADWARLAPVWRDLQETLGLPAPGIVVSGSTAIELWFSWRDPVPMAELEGFLESLRQHWLGDVPPHRVSRPVIDPETLPPRQCAAEQWSAFVAPDLVPLFSETPWLDVAPNDEGQAHLLSQLQSITAAEWHAARAVLSHEAAPAATPSPAPLQLPATDDPRRFLLSVMNDERVPLALRIDAAKALLP